MEMSRPTRDGTAEPVSRDQILRRERGQGNIHLPCSADHEQDWQPYPVDPYSCYICDHTYIHAEYPVDPCCLCYTHTHILILVLSVDTASLELYSSLDIYINRGEIRGTLCGIGFEYPPVGGCVSTFFFHVQVECVLCVCVFFPFILDIKFVGRTSRGHTGGRSHGISHPPSFCGASLHFSREKDSAIPFPRRL